MLRACIDSFLCGSLTDIALLFLPMDEAETLGGFSRLGGRKERHSQHCLAGSIFPAMKSAIGILKGFTSSAAVRQGLGLQFVAAGYQRFNLKSTS